LVVWAAEDRVMPPEHGRRLAQLLPDATHVEIADSYTLVPLDQPAELARHVREFSRRPTA
jgi:pimeloyl-ACP methyl ester carboxylesterase